MRRKPLSFLLSIFLLASFIYVLIPLVHPQTGITLVQGPIMPIIQASNDSNFNFMASGSYLAYFKSDSDLSKATRFKIGDYVLDFDIAVSQAQWYNSQTKAVMGNSLNPQHTSLATSDQRFIYNGAWNNVNLTYTAQIDSLGELLSINSLPSNISAADFFRFRIDVYYNSSMIINVNGINFTNPSNVVVNTIGQISFMTTSKLQYWIPPPTIWDSVGHNATATYFLSLNNGVDLWYLAVPYAFLQSAVYPIYLDPPVNVNVYGRGTVASGSSVSVTMNATLTTGDIEVAVVGLQTSTNPVSISNISQTGVTWTYQANSTTLFSTIYMIDTEIWFGIVGSGSSTSITVNLNASSVYDVTADIFEYSGVATSSFLDVGAKNSTTSNQATGNTGNTSTTTGASELWIGVVTGNGHVQSNPTNGFTLYDGAATADNNLCVGYLEKIVTSTGNAYTQISFSSNTIWVGCIATFKAASSLVDLTFTNAETLTKTGALTKWTAYTYQNLATITKTVSSSLLTAYLIQPVQTITKTANNWLGFSLNFQPSAILVKTSSPNLYTAVAFRFTETVTKTANNYMTVSLTGMVNLVFALVETLTKTSQTTTQTAVIFINQATVTKTATLSFFDALGFQNLVTMTKSSASSFAEELGFFKSETVAKSSSALSQVGVGIWAFVSSSTETIQKSSSISTILPTPSVPPVSEGSSFNPFTINLTQIPHAIAVFVSKPPVQISIIGIIIIAALIWLIFTSEEDKKKPKEKTFNDKPSEKRFKDKRND